MNRPLFSVLVPTRERPDTLRHTLATVTSQGRGDYEIVVADNCSSPETFRVVEELGSTLVRYTRSDEVLPMASNWERGLSMCRGEYVTVLGDDDAFLPSTLLLAEKLIQTTNADLVAWRPQTYWWPNTIAYWIRNRLYLSFGSAVKVMNSRLTLERFYAGSIGFGLLPTVYNGFFHRRIIEEACRRFGGFFVPADVPPDVSSGILGLHLTQRFAFSDRSLTLRGNSAKSNGTAHWMRSLGNEQREIYLREERTRLKDMIHPSLVPSPNLQIVIANTQLKCRECYFPDDSNLVVDLQSVVSSMLGGLNHDPAAYDENLRDARELAAKIGMDIDADCIPPREMGEKPSGWGPIIDEHGQIEGLSVHCDLAGAFDVAAAARLVEALSPPAATFLEGATRNTGTSAADHSYEPTPTVASKRPRHRSFIGRMLSDIFSRQRSR